MKSDTKTRNTKKTLVRMLAAMLIGGVIGGISTVVYFTSSLPLSDIEKLLELPFIDADNREQLERILELDNEETIQVNFTSP